MRNATKQLAASVLRQCSGTISILLQYNPNSKWYCVMCHMMNMQYIQYVRRYNNNEMQGGPKLWPIFEII